MAQIDYELTGCKSANASDASGPSDKNLFKLRKELMNQTDLNCIQEEELISLRKKNNGPCASYKAEMSKEERDGLLAEIQYLKQNGNGCQEVLEREVFVVDPKLVAQIEEFEKLEHKLTKAHKKEIKHLTEKNDKEVEKYMEKAEKIKHKFKKEVQHEYKKEINENEYNIALLTA